VAENQYNVIVGAQTDLTGFSKSLNSQLRSLEKDAKIDVRVQTDEKALKKLHENYKLVGDDFKKIRQDIKTTFTYIDTNGVRRSVDKVTETFKNASGEVQKLETYIAHYGNVTKILDSKVTSSSKIFEGYNKTLKNTKASLQEIEKYSHTFMNQNGEKVTETFSINNNGEEIKRLTYLYEELGVTKKRITEQTKDENGVWGEEKQLLNEVTINEIELINAKNKEKQAAEEAIKKEEAEAEAIRKKNEELSRSTILYEENSKFRDSQGNIVTNRITTNELGETYNNQTIEFYDTLGRLIQDTTRWKQLETGEWVRAGNTTRKVLDDQIAKEEEAARALKDANKAHEDSIRKKQETEAKATAELQKRITAVNTYKGKEKEVYDLRDKTIHKLQSEVKETTNANNEMTRVTTTTDKFIDSQGMLNTKVTEATEKFKIVDGQLKKVGDTLEKTTTNVEKSKTGLNQLGQSFSDIIVKVAKFYLASLPIRAMQTAITSAIQSVKDFDSALTEFKKVSDLSGESLEGYTEKLERLGKLTARTRTEMVELATEFKRSGFSDSDAATLAQVGSLYQNIADEELSASDAASVLISQIKAFNFEAEDAEHVIDAVNEVANRNAVSSGDIGRGLTQAGAALSTYGNTFEQTIGLVTAGTEIFQNRSQQVARGLNTVASRIAKNEKALKQYGVEVYDQATGDLRSTYDILKDLSQGAEGVTKTWEQMSKAEQVALGTTLAGY